jgi:hypothetical protein
MTLFYRILTVLSTAVYAALLIRGRMTFSWFVCVACCILAFSCLGWRKRA